MKELTPAQQLWGALGLPYEAAKHGNGGFMNSGFGPTHKGWALHKLIARNKKRGTYRKPIGIGRNERRADRTLP